MSVGVGSNGAEQDKAINAGLFGSGERSFPGLPSIKRIHLDTRFVFNPCCKATEAIETFGALRQRISFFASRGSCSSGLLRRKGCTALFVSESGGSPTTNPMTITYGACWLFCCVLCGFL